MNTISTWNGTDYREIYLRQLKENSVYYDENLKLWVVYSYDYCKTILLSADMHIPEPIINDASQLNHTAKLLLRSFTRLSNNMHHHDTRGAAMTVFQKITQMNAGNILKGLLKKAPITDGFDWERMIGRQLPARLICAGLNVDGPDTEYIVANLSGLAPIMSPNKTEEIITKINPVAEAFYAIAKKQLAALELLTGQRDVDDLIICNLVGLFIQSYDGSRGLLGNTLMSLAAYWNEIDNDNYKSLVNETLRHDAPVHNTRRIAVKNVSIGGKTIKSGESVLVVLGAANLDGRVFEHPERFDLKRPNAGQHLTFGLGGHSCLAKYFCIDMAVDVCRFVKNNYSGIEILQNTFEYEPQLNVRLVKQLMVRFL